MIMKNTWKFIALAAALIAVVAAGIVGGRWDGDNRKSNFSDSCELFVYPGMETSLLLESIPDSVVMRRRSLATRSSSPSQPRKPSGCQAPETNSPWRAMAFSCVAKSSKCATPPSRR